jgi:hypothetical protein
MALGLPQPSLLDQDNECGTSGQTQHLQSSTFVQQQMVQGINTKNSTTATCILKWGKFCIKVWILTAYVLVTHS